MDMMKMKGLQEDEMKLKMEFESLQRQLNAVERPSTAVKQSLGEIDNGGKEKWL